MKLKVNKDKCIGCGQCVSLTDQKVFDFNEEGLAEAITEEIPQDLVEISNEAKNNCPTEAIEEE